MASQKTAAILTIAGGVFYVIGGAVVALLVALLSSSSGGLGLGSGFLDPCTVLAQVGYSCGSSSTSTTSASSLGGSGLDAIGYGIAGFGVAAGILIIIGGLLFRSDIASRRKIAGIVVIVMMLLGSLATLGGLVIGFILVAIGAYLGLTYKSNTRGMVFGLGPIGSVTIGSSAPPASQSSSPAGTGPLSYCIKCGSKVREGAVFCGACGARLE